MDKKLRGQIEENLDSMQEWKITEMYGWVVSESPFIGEDTRDFFLGCWVGRAYDMTMNVVRRSKVTTRPTVTDNDRKEIQTMITRRLSEVREKIERELNR